MSFFQPRDPFRELRKNPRYEIHSLAQLDVPGGVPINCIISDLSASGAKLTTRDQAAIPNEFALVFRRNCRIVHRFDGQIGVQFV
jgi:PilZ domain